MTTPKTSAVTDLLAVNAAKNGSKVKDVFFEKESKK